MAVAARTPLRSGGPEDIADIGRIRDGDSQDKHPQNPDASCFVSLSSNLITNGQCGIKTALADFFCEEGQVSTLAVCAPSLRTLRKSSAVAHDVALPVWKPLASVHLNQTKGSHCHGALRLQCNKSAYFSDSVTVKYKWTGASVNSTCTPSRITLSRRCPHYSAGPSPVWQKEGLNAGRILQ